MYNTSNPAELYPNTTWELLPDNKFIKTGSTPLIQAGSNNIKIVKANLPTDKLQVESFNLTRGTMEITGTMTSLHEWAFYSFPPKDGGAFSIYKGTSDEFPAGKVWQNSYGYNFNASKTWSGSTSSASPYTSAMGNGTAIAINPEHITVKAWKRLT